MGKVDIATKQYMSHRDVIADVFNFYIYDGRQVIKPEKITEDRYGRGCIALWQ